MSYPFGRSNPRFVDMSGKVCGLLTVVDLSHFKNSLAVWNCVCECGSLAKVKGSCLRSGNTKSCGCTRKINASANARRASTTHGMHGSPTYDTWQSILARCNKSSHKSFQYYGGKGVKVCDEWRRFENFLRDMGVRPIGTTIDRINSDGNYEPGNCQWATPKDQANNRSNNRWHSYLGETKTTAQWAEDARCAVNGPTFCKRIDSGWPIEYAISAPHRSALKSLLHFCNNAPNTPPPCHNAPKDKSAA